MKAAVRQIKGPGMNLGLKKPRINYIPKPKPYKQSKAVTDAAAAVPSSYLPSVPAGKMPKMPKAPKVPTMKSPKKPSFL